MHNKTTARSEKHKYASQKILVLFFSLSSLLTEKGFESCNNNINYCFSFSFCCYCSACPVPTKIVILYSNLRFLHILTLLVYLYRYRRFIMLLIISWDYSDPTPVEWLYVLLPYRHKYNIIICALYRNLYMWWNHSSFGISIVSDQSPRSSN